MEIWIDNSYNLTYNPGTEKWYDCPQMNWGTTPPTCDGTPLDFDAELGFASLAVGADDTKKQVNIGGCDQMAQRDRTYVYELASAANGNQAGLYEAQMTE